MSYLSQIQNTEQGWSESKAQLLAVGIFQNQELTPLGQTIDEHLAGVISKAVRLDDLTGKPGESRTFYDDDRIILIMGLGKNEDFDSEAIRKAGGSIAKTALSLPLIHI